MGSYRPIALTSAIGTVLQRLITSHLTWWLEEQSTLIPWQAGFSQGRSTTVQCLRLSQFISDGFQSTQRRRRVATIFHLSRAFDRFWRTRLLMQRSNISVPLRLTQWLSSLFIIRTNRVRLNGSIGLSRIFNEGQPHGSILFRHLFTIYINDLMVEFENDTFVGAYADDHIVVRNARKNEMILASLQPELDKVVAWSAKAILTLNSSIKQPSSNWTEQKRSDNPTSPLTENECSQSHADFLVWQVRPATHLWKACPKALHIDVGPHQPPLCSERHDLGMAHIGLSSGLHRGCA